tara:strand:- start:74 stop:385 length:312 start_codon:yes stop_codon:yes gene_type:complete
MEQNLILPPALHHPFLLLVGVLGRIKDRLLLVVLVVVQEIILEVVDQVLEQQIKDMLVVKVEVTRHLIQLVVAVAERVLLVKDFLMDQTQAQVFPKVEMVEMV